MIYLSLAQLLSFWGGRSKLCPPGKQVQRFFSSS
uniref:Uncharacterized protein n=1 Tax=Anguilla anguilla TaxID=7936 RepID=A0A0E9RDS8_ANGAN